MFFVNLHPFTLLLNFVYFLVNVFLCETKEKKIFLPFQFPPLTHFIVCILSFFSSFSQCTCLSYFSLCMNEKDFFLRSLKEWNAESFCYGSVNWNDDDNWMNESKIIRMLITAKQYIKHHHQWTSERERKLRCLFFPLDDLTMNLK
jgi:hypothetical protein